jgi:PEP-CTERM motif
MGRAPRTTSASRLRGRLGPIAAVLPGHLYSQQSAGFELLSFGIVPEPSTWAMMALGFASLGFAAYRKARPVVLVA